MVRRPLSQVAGSTLRQIFPTPRIDRFVDRFAGAVLVANLGGLHRHFAPAGNTGFGFGKITEGKGHEIGLGAMASVEALLPGGEVMFNSNRVRTGGDNRAYASQLILTFDDLGYDGNQSAMFKPEEVFTNLAAVGMTVRVTDNRLRERARSTAMSTLALSFGLARAGYAGDTLETSAAVTLDQVEGGFEISKSALTLTGKVPGISAEEFARIAKEAEMNCPVSKLLDCEITLEHRLES